MLALAAVVFAIAFVLTSAGIASAAVFSPLAVTFASLDWLAFHSTGRGLALSARHGT